jgi:hypothetical protein
MTGDLEGMMRWQREKRELAARDFLLYRRGVENERVW